MNSYFALLQYVLVGSAVVSTISSTAAFQLAPIKSTQSTVHNSYKGQCNNKNISHLHMVATPPSKYPTERGSTVDSRKIISKGLAKTNLKAIRMKHILFATEDLATSSLYELRSAGLFFDDLAKQISNCVESREQGGEIGWVNAVDDDDSDGNDHLDLILPQAARNEVLRTSSKVRFVCCDFVIFCCICLNCSIQYLRCQYAYFVKFISITINIIMFHIDLILYFILLHSLVILSWSNQTVDSILFK